MKGFFIAANWKMNKTNSEATDFVKALKPLIENTTSTVILCPSFLAIPILKGMSIKKLKIGAQNLHEKPRGTFTGEISGEMLFDAGVQYVLVGHSERRHIFGESDQTVAKKLAAAIENKLVPILCIGETYSQKVAGETESVLKNQLGVALSEVVGGTEFLVAYEPVWAISSGDPNQPKLTPTATEIGDIHKFIKELLKNNGHKNINILYGGSANDKNCVEFSKIDGVDGFLIGGASLDKERFASMINSLE